MIKTEKEVRIELVLPIMVWRYTDSGIARISRLLEQLSPYRDQPLCVDGFAKLTKESECYLAFDPTIHHGHFVGMIRLVVKRRYGVIHDMIVDADYRQRGIGKALVREVLKAAGKLHLKHVELEPKPARVAANQLCQSMGFELVSPADPNIEGSANRYQIKL